MQKKCGDFANEAQFQFQHILPTGSKQRQIKKQLDTIKIIVKPTKYIISIRHCKWKTSRLAEVSRRCATKLIKENVICKKLGLFFLYLFLRCFPCNDKTKPLLQTCYISSSRCFDQSATECAVLGKVRACLHSKITDTELLIN